MKVLFVFSIGFDIEHSSTILMNNVLEDVIKKGISVHYIVPNETGLPKNCPETLKSSKLLTYDVIKRTPPKKHQMIKRYVEGILYAFKTAKYIYRIKDYDVIYVQSTPTAFWNILICKVFGHKKPVIYSVLDMFPGSTIASGAMQHKLLQKIFYLIQKVAYNMSTHIMALSEDMKRKIIEQGVPENKITYFNTWFDSSSSVYVNDQSNSFIKEFNMNKEKFYVQYAGNIGYVFDVDLFINIANKLKAEKNIVFQLVARGSQLDYIKEKMNEKKLNNIAILPIQPVNRINEVYSACDIQFIPLKKDVLGNSFPSKLAHVMHCKKTFVCVTDENTVFFNIANEEKIGKCVNTEKEDEIVEAILTFYKSEKELLTYCENAFNFSNCHFSRELNTEIIISQIKEKAGGIIL